MSSTLIEILTIGRIEFLQIVQIYLKHKVTLQLKKACYGIH